MIRVEGNAIQVETKTLTATVTDGWLTSLRRRGGGGELVPQAAEAAKGGPALELVYPSAGAGAGFCPKAR